MRRLRCRLTGQSFLTRSGSRGSSLCRLAVTATLLLGAAPAGANWWSENFEVHGFVTSKVYFRTADFQNQVQTSSWRTELNLETSLHLYERGDFRADFYTVIRPTYDAIYEIQGDIYGEHVDRAAFGTSPAFPDDPIPGAGLGVPAPRSFAETSGNGKGGEETCLAAGFASDCVGARVNDEFTLINSDTGSLFGQRDDPSLPFFSPGADPLVTVPAIAIDNVVFFGRVTAPVMPRGSAQGQIGGNATGDTYGDLANNLGDPTLAASLAMASMGLSTPLNSYQGAIGDVGSFKRGSVDMNRREKNLAFDCVDNEHPC